MAGTEGRVHQAACALLKKRLPSTSQPAAAQFRHRRAVRDDDRRSARLSLEDGQAEPLPVRAVRQHVQRPVPLRQITLPGQACGDQVLVTETYLALRDAQARR